MKTTLDLPDALVKQVKLRALHKGQKLKDAVADLLRRGLLASSTQNGVEDEAVITTDKETGLPLVKCRRPARPGQEITPERAAEILLEQEVEWHNAANR
jgi:hypothetical protein